MAKTAPQTTTKAPKELTHQQLLFVAEYVKRGCKDQAGAAVAAGYSEKTAASQACQLLKNPKVAELVDVRMRAAADLAEASAAEILRELKKIGFSDITDLFGADGKMLPVKQWPERIRHAIASIEVHPIFKWNDKLEKDEHVGDEVKVKLWPKTTALDLLGSNLKLWTEQIDAKIAGSIQVIDPYAEPKGGAK